MSQVPGADEAVEGNRAAQTVLYGKTLKDRLGTLMGTYSLSQRSLAKVLGISPPMLSQLISAHRVKMGNPLSYERMVELERRSPEAAGGHGAEVLAEVAASDIATTTQLRVSGTPDATPPAAPATALEDIPLRELRAARDLLAQGQVAPRLVSLIDTRLAAARPHDVNPHDVSP
ncbi:MAG: DNA-binding protein [Galactobacter sp.]